jgi:diacylglycerol kinase (ATP)
MLDSPQPFSNYFGIGADGEIALRFHQTREQNPRLFFHRVFNKVLYALFGGEAILAQALETSKCTGFTDSIEFIADGKVVKLPNNVQGLVFCNINSYLGGVQVWHHSDEDGSSTDFGQVIDSELESIGSESAVTPLPQTSERIGLRSRLGGDRVAPSSTSPSVGSKMGPHSLQDGMLEVIAVRGAFHLGQLQARLDRPIKICQCRSASIRTHGAFPMQLDGEPWLQGPCELKVEKKVEPVYFLRKSTSPAGELAAEVNSLFEWACSTGMISKSVEEKLTLEFSRRIDKKILIS